MEIHFRFLIFSLVILAYSGNMPCTNSRGYKLAANRRYDDSSCESVIKKTHLNFEWKAVDDFHINPKKPWERLDQIKFIVDEIKWEFMIELRGYYFN